MWVRQSSAGDLVQFMGHQFTILHETIIEQTMGKSAVESCKQFPSSHQVDSWFILLWEMDHSDFQEKSCEFQGASCLPMSSQDTVTAVHLSSHLFYESLIHSHPISFLFYLKV